MKSLKNIAVNQSIIMKRLTNCLWVLLGLVVSVNGCEKSDTLPKKGCEGAGETVFEVSNEVGRIMYHEDANAYYLSYHVPKTYDQVLTGTVCNMPTEFPQQKEYLEVIFSGVFKEMENNSGTGIIGYDMYYLELTNIRLKQEN